MPRKGHLVIKPHLPIHEIPVPGTTKFVTGLCALVVQALDLAT